MDDLQSEKEQIEEMRRWWSENGRYVIGGIVLGAGLLFGWNQYTSNKLAAQVEASALFETLANNVGDGDLEAAQEVANKLANSYANTSYAAQSKLAMARLLMDKNRDQDAVEVLRELLELPGSDELKHVGRLRLAKILLYQDRAEEVIELLDSQDNVAFAALYADAMGDAYAALGQVSQAEEAYRTALAEAAQGTVDRALVQMKLIDLPDAAETQADVQLDPAETENPTEVDTAPDQAEVESGPLAEGAE